jgi:hypothetical protein
MFSAGDQDPAARQASATTSNPPVVPENVGAVESPSPGANSSASPSAAPAAPAATAATAPSTPTTTLAAPNTALPTPTGRCSDDDVKVTAAVPKAEATRNVWVALTIQTNVQAACLWTVSSKSLQVEITSGSDQVWSSIQCPAAIATKELTLRSDTPVAIGVKWNSRRSDEGCSDHTQWALPGYYHARAAALGGEPVDLQFKLTKPTPVVVVTPSATPAATGTAPATNQKKNPKKKGARSEPTGSPVVHPD